MLILWTGLPGGIPAPPALALWFAAATSLACTVVESIPLPIDDNVAICISGGAFLAWLSQASVPGHLDYQVFGAALLVSVSLGAVALIIRGISRTGFFSGILLGTVVYYAFGIAGFLVLAGFFFFGTLFTKLGYKRKSSLGAAQPDGSRRSATNVWGKGIAGLLAAAAALFLRDPSVARLAFVAAMAASLADTTATELGLLAGGRPFLLTTRKRVPPGTRGAISLAGSFSGALAALAMAAAGYGLGLVSSRGMAWAVVAAVLSTHLESLLASRGGSSAASGPVMNAFHTVVAALVAVLLGRIGL